MLETEPLPGKQLVHVSRPRLVAVAEAKANVIFHYQMVPLVKKSVVLGGLFSNTLEFAAGSGRHGTGTEVL